MSRSKYYIKKIATVGCFEVWLVDGELIRYNLDIEFTNFGQHYRFNFIPVKEFWIDKERTPGEEEFYIDHMLIEQRLMSNGKSYDEALQKADLAEKKQRMKMDFIAKHISINKFKKHSLEKVRKKLLKIYSKSINVWIVNGELVRDLFFVDFTEGGHDKVYGFIPAGEVWLDDDLSKTEIKFVLIHELHERYLMSCGMDYLKAHRDASHIEYLCRHNPNLLAERMREVLELNNK